MKKALFLAITAVVLASCGGKSTEAAAETPAVEAVAADTTATAVVADTTAAAPAAEVKVEAAAPAAVPAK